MNYDAKDLELLVPGSTAYTNNGVLIWEAPKGGGRLSGKKQEGNGGQDEGQESLFTIERPFWFRGTPARPWLFEENKDGIKFRTDDWRMTHCHWRRPGEDCVTSFGRGGSITDCTFSADGDSDKCLQLNVCDGARIKRCSFFGFITAIQCGLAKYATVHDRSFVTDCYFDDCACAIKSIKGTVFERDNHFYDGENQLKVDNGGRFAKL